MKKVKTAIFSLTILSALFFNISCKTLSQDIAYAMDPFTSLIGNVGSIMEDTGIADTSPVASLIANSAQSIDSLNRVMLDVDPELEYIIGRSAVSYIMENYNFYRNNAATVYLNKICAALALNSPKPYLYKGYFVAVLDSDEINAISTPGGHILISRGLIESARSEDALAAVIAHELSHIQLGHSSQCIKDARKENLGKNMAETISDAVGVAANNSDSESFKEAASLVSSIKDGFVSFITKGYPKEQEYDADENAITLLVNAGYNPYALLDMLDEIKNHKTYSGKGWEKTHPAPELRIEKVNRVLKKGGYQVVSQTPREARFQLFKKNF